ncbi:MAG TPA: MFS transporter [Jatrophihabitans sp.]|jgi:MFS family permease|uniref:MFS transporter n=1 Tax=Jatrophihabitans sp. TaxID=1932789 RepID=UPI002E008F6F|nr:MFS transporter [Jatrophihabitans sp.]
MTTVLETSQSTPTGTRTLPRAAAFWLVAATTAGLLAASSAPSPLYPVLQREFGFSSLTLTAIFAVYVLALLISLLTVGRLSDFVGRRPVLAGALVVEAASMALFLGADGVGWLVAARVVQGLATGAAVGVLGAYLLDLQPGDGSRLGSLVNSVAPTSGLGLGAIVTGLLVQYAPHPTRLVFAILTGLFVLLALLVAALPETVRREPGALAALRPKVAVPPRARRAFAAAVPTMVSTWALGGLMLSVGGSLLGAVFGVTDHAAVGLVIGLFAASGAAAALATRDLQPAPMTRLGTVALVAGVALFIVALAVTSLTVFVVAALVAGAGFGSAFLGALRSLTQLAEPHERAALLSAVYVVSYIAFSVPAVVAGLLITHEGLRDTSLGYGAFVAVTALIAAYLARQTTIQESTAVD